MSTRPYVQGVVLCATLILAVSLSACGGHDRSPAPAPSATEVMRTAAVNAVLAFEPRARCEQALTARLMTRVYGTRARCRRVVSASSASPLVDPEIVAARLSGGRGVVRMIIRNGDDPDVTGTVRLRYGRAGWRIDAYGADFLRSELPRVVAGHLGVVDPVTAADVDACLSGSFVGAGRAELTRIGYDVAGARRPGLRIAYRRLAECRSADRRSPIREAFEREMRDALRPSGAVETRQFGCVMRGMRVFVSDRLIADTLASGDVDGGSRAARRIAGELDDAARACSAPGLHL